MADMIRRLFILPRAARQDERLCVLMRVIMQLFRVLCRGARADASVACAAAAVTRTAIACLSLLSHTPLSPSLLSAPRLPRRH